MSLSSWSYPFYEDKPIEKRATSRKKITQPMKRNTTEDDNLADFKPVPPPVVAEPQLPPEEPQFEEPPFAFVPNVPPIEHNMSDKINYMIRLLEDQKDEKTGRVAEEMVLYVFLGVFVIFVLDTFVKTGKYSR